MSYNPETGLVYIPGQDNSFTYRADLQNFLGIVFGRTAEPESTVPTITPPFIGKAPPEGEPGFLVAWDPVTQQERWRVTYPTRENSGTLTTAGNLVFHGTAEGLFQAHDAETGAVLWETELLGTMGSPITYQLDGRQYVTIISGTPENNPPGRVFTFALGESSRPARRRY
jgi:quinohemoprotein ethanol dehydrogenase